MKEPQPLLTRKFPLAVLDNSISPPQTLAVILMNPPLGDGAATRRNLSAALSLLGGPEVTLTNLFTTATRNVADINLAGREWAAWGESRPPLERAIAKSDQLLFGWGVGSLSGAARLNFERQVRWVFDTARSNGHTTSWTLGGEARHPSRWHQFVSDRHGRTTGGSLVERVAQVLVPIDLARATVPATR